jgi:uncharacterized protein
LSEAGGQAGRPMARGTRVLWLAAGWVLVGIGFVGIFVPLLPTVDFLILALPCFARASPRLESWLLDHPRFGPSLRAWRRERAVPVHAKILACTGMAAGFLLFMWHVHPSVRVGLPVLCVLLLSAGWLLRRPTPARQG